MLEFAPSRYAFHEDPYAFYRPWRQEVPVYPNEEMGFGAAFAQLPIVFGERG